MERPIVRRVISFCSPFAPRRESIKFKSRPRIVFTESCNRGKLLLKTAFCLGSDRCNARNRLCDTRRSFRAKRGGGGWRHEGTPRKFDRREKRRQRIAFARCFSSFRAGKKKRRDPIRISSSDPLKLSACRPLAPSPFSLSAHRPTLLGKTRAAEYQYV